MSERTRVLDGRYRIEEILGRGGMATVYRATDQSLGRTVAVKVLSRRFAADERFVTRFRREAQAAAALNHPNIVSVFDSGDAGGLRYIVMEYVEGTTLSDLLAREGPPDPGRAVSITRSICHALAAAHADGLVHRDVKPGNVMLDQESEVKVMDFGIARAATDDSLTLTGTVLGTASYLSPEQARGESVDPRSDVYSVGCVLYEMLTGAPPFSGESPVATALQHVSEEPTPPRSVRPEVPEKLETVVLRALSKDPGDRYPDAGALDRALAEVDAAAEPPPTPTLPQQTAVLPTTRVRRWVWPAVVAGLAVLGFLLGLLLFGGEERSPAGRTEPPSPTPTAQSPPATPETVTDALAGVAAVLDEGVAAGEISERSAEQVMKHATRAVERHADGDLNRALREVADARGQAIEAFQRGEITAEDRLIDLEEALDAMAVTIRSTMPPTVEQEEDPGDDEGPGGGPPDDVPGEGQGPGGNSDDD